MKKISLIVIVIAALIGFSSCQSLRIDKRHYNRGWYVDFGTDKKAEAPTINEEKEAAVAVNSEEQPEEATVVPAPALNNGTTAEQLPANNSREATVVTNTTQTEEPVVTGSETQNFPKAVKKNKEKASTPGSSADDRLILLVILAIFIPPLAVYLKQGVTPMFWITLICWLIGGAFLFGRFGYGYIGGLGLLAVVLALLVVFDVI